MEQLQEWLAGQGLNDQTAPLVAAGIAAAGLLLLAALAQWIARRVLLRTVQMVAEATTSTWDDAFVDRKVFHWLAHLVPALLIHILAPVAFASYPQVVAFVETVAFLYIAFVLLLVINAALNAVLDIYDSTSLARRVPIKPLVQVLKGVFFFGGAMVMSSTLMGRSPVVLLSGLGAFTAVLLLVFKDPILGLAAGVQLISNNMVAKGDWIAVPKFGADGVVTDVSLTTVSVQNWDKTISTIPTYAMLTDTFRNWRGMEDSGGRRIKRAVHIDMTSIRFVDEAMLTELRKVQSIRDYLDTKAEELAAHNRERGVDESSPVNGRRMTNIGTFRKYLEAYLRDSPNLHQDMTFLVRQLAPAPQGLPIEIYVFSNDQRWVEYEAIQADIFDHVLAVIPLFGLRAYQQPSAADFQSLSLR